MSAKNHAIIRGGVVIAVIFWDAEKAPDYRYPDDHDEVVQSDTAGVGWTYEGGVFTDPEAPPDDPAP